jgi:hypothetical protein
MKVTNFETVCRLYNHFGYLVVGFSRPVPLGHVFAIVNAGFPRERARLPQPFSVISEATEQDWLLQHEFCFQQGLIPRMYPRAARTKFYFKTVTE